VTEIGIFGSYVRGEQKRGSDIDIIVGFEEPVSLLKLVSLENFLKDIIGMKLEVIPKKDLRIELRERILKETTYI
jgi:predicted nucleotidyltransferase